MSQPIRLHTKNRLSILLVSGILLWVQLAIKADVTVAWDPVQQAVIYTVYWGTNSRSYDHSNSCPGIETNLTATGLLANQPYFFAVSASAADGTQSSLSTEISFTTPSSTTEQPTPGITTQPSCVSVQLGEQAQFSVVATGAQSYQWYLNGAALVDGGEFSGSGTATLTINPAGPADAALYNVVVANSSGSSTSSIVVLTAVGLPVVAGGEGTEPPIGQLPATAVNLGQSVSLTVPVADDAPVLYQWQFDGSDIAGATTQQLVLGAVSDADAGSYTVVVSSGGSSATGSVPFILGVIDPPAIVTGPQSQTAIAGTSVMFTVASTGTAPVYKWYKNGALLGDGGNKSGAASATLTLNAISENDAGSYVVVLTNSAGVATSEPAVLTVVTPPQIISQPASVAVAQGQTAVWGVGVIGAPPFTYQWSFNGRIIPGANRSLYYINSVEDSENGTYTVVIGNAMGTVQSDPATLTVIP